MEVSKAIKGRRSVRKYKSKEVKEEKLKKILKAAQWAPSSRNTQPWHFIIVKNKTIRKKLKKAAHDQEFISEAPIVIVACKEKGSSLVNIGLALQNICLQAYSLGLGTCIVGWVKKEKVREILNIPEKYEPTYLVPLGYPDEEPTSDRKELEEIVHYGKW